MAPTVVFFDGVCNLCNSTIDRLLRLDHKRNLRFASLQGKAAKELLGPEADALASIIVVREGQIFRESDAIIEIGRALGGIHRFGTHLMVIIPRGLRDWVYRLIARNRYKLFGERDTCRVPTAEERAQFLD